jgi:membrane AbrB-like protein
MPPPLRDAAFILLGCSMGAAVTPESIAQIRAWPLSLVLLAGSVAAIFMLGSAYLRRVHGWDAVTARFASIPGAFSAVIVHAASTSADLPRVVLAQGIRVFTLVAVMPWLLDPGGSVPQAPALAADVSSLAGLLATLGVGAVAGLGVARLGVPAGAMVGAMVASAILHGTGIVEGRPPAELMAGGFVATGALIGIRFRGATFALVAGTLPGAAGSVVLALILSAGFAALGSHLLGLPFGQLWLAYAPGGVEAMAIMALALAIDPAFVGAHHVARILGLNLVGPFMGRGRGGKGGGSGGASGGAVGSPPARKP